MRLARIITLEVVNRVLREQYIAEFNQRFAVAAAEKGSSFLGCSRRDLEQLFAIQL